MPADRMLVRGACAESPVLQKELLAFIQRQIFATLRNEVFFSFNYTRSFVAKTVHL